MLSNGLRWLLAFSFPGLTVWPRLWPRCLTQTSEVWAGVDAKAVPFCTGRAQESRETKHWPKQAICGPAAEPMEAVSGPEEEEAGPSAALDARREESLLVPLLHCP
jgi:hypothetical protein